MEEINTVSNVASENVDFSMYALFMSADLVVKSVILILIFASIYSWSIIVSKLLRLRKLKQITICVYILKLIRIYFNKEILLSINITFLKLQTNN